MSIVAMVTQFHFIICDKMSLLLKSIVNKYYIKYIIHTNNFFFLLFIVFSSSRYTSNIMLFSQFFCYLAFYFFFEFQLDTFVFFSSITFICYSSFFHFNQSCTPYWDESKKKSLAYKKLGNDWNKVTSAFRNYTIVFHALEYVEISHAYIFFDVHSSRTLTS